jgi:hypothetical protein
MTLADQYARAVWPDPVKILGRTLRPYCIGHALLLHRVGNSFVSEGTTRAEGQDISGIGDLLEALWVCSRPWQEAVAGLRKRRTRWLLRFWDWQLRKPSAAMAVVSAEVQLRRYFADAWRPPDRWDKGHDVSKTGAPILASLKVILMGVFHVSEEKALSWTVSAALWDTAAWNEFEGSVQLVSDSEISGVEEILKHQRN